MFHFCNTSRHALGPVQTRSVAHPDTFWSPSSLLFNGYGGSCSGAKRPGRDANHSPPSSKYVLGNGGVTNVAPASQAVSCTVLLILALRFDFGI
jgi:hypothetical protein